MPTTQSPVDRALSNLPDGAKNNITNWTFKINDDIYRAGAWGSTKELGLTKLLSILNSNIKDAKDTRLPLNYYINKTRLYLQMHNNNEITIQTLNKNLKSLAQDINDISSMLEKKQVSPRKLHQCPINYLAKVFFG